MSHPYSFTASGLSMDRSSRFSHNFASHDGYRILGTIATEEHKLLQDTKKILDKRITLDEQYGRNLQELTASADRIAWPATTQPIASVCREVFLQWSHVATTINSNAEQFRRTIMDNLLKELIEQKHDSKKFLEDEKRRYDTEHRKASSEVAEAEKRYFDDAKTYTAKCNESNKLANSNRKGDESRLKHLKEAVTEKYGNLCRTHNDYIYKLREYNFIDEQYVRKIRELLIYHEEAQLTLSKSWQHLLRGIANYVGQNPDGTAASIEAVRQMVSSIDPRRCYDEICRSHANTQSISTSPQVFNELLLQASNLTKLKANEFLADTATKHDIRKRIKRLKSDIDISIPKILDNIKDKQTSYQGRKTTFERELNIENLQIKNIWKAQIRNELTTALINAGYRPDDRPDDDSDSDCDEDISDRLEDQLYFHGVIPRVQSLNQLINQGDYLVRINEQGRIVLSILWADPQHPDRLKDGHFYIQENNKMFQFQSGSISKPTVSELLAFYKRQRTLLREDGTRLIRPIARPDYMINNDDVQTGEILGKGHFGQVVRGEYRGRTVAVKVLHPSSADRSARDRQNFINEALLLQQYKHKNIVQFIGIAALRIPMMIVMEIIENGSLDIYLKKNELRGTQLIQMCYDIAKGMEYLEKSNVIHRDLAARNCLVDKKSRVKVADFGLSRCLQSDEEYFCQIKEVPVRWWAVEVFSNAPYTNKSDVWSYGVTAWEVFSKAETPYGYIQHNHAVMDAIKHGERLKQPEKCPPKVFTTISTCWMLGPQDRPSFEKLVEFFKKEKSVF